MPYDQLNYSKTYFNFIFYILIHLKSFFVVGFEVVCGSLMVSYMPSLMCVEIGLWFTYTPYPNHTIVITVKKWFVVHLHTTPNPFLEFYI